MKRTLFMIDDDADDQDFFREALANVDESVEFVSAFDGVDALDMLRRKQVKPDIIFLDNNMPRMSGLECLIKLKKDEALSQIPIFIYSTSSSPEFQRQCRENGANRYFQKPNGFPELIQILSQVLQ